MFQRALDLLVEQFEGSPKDVVAGMVTLGHGTILKGQGKRR